jgi:hypothetical protein
MLAARKTARMRMRSGRYSLRARRTFFNITNAAGSGGRIYGFPGSPAKCFYVLI